MTTERGRKKEGEEERKRGEWKDRIYFNMLFPFHPSYYFPSNFLFLSILVSPSNIFERERERRKEEESERKRKREEIERESQSLCNQELGLLFQN